VTLRFIQRSDGTLAREATAFRPDAVLSRLEMVHFVESIVVVWSQDRSEARFETYMACGHRTKGQPLPTEGRYRLCKPCRSVSQRVRRVA
jgi:hypothetical protein